MATKIIFTFNGSQGTKKSVTISNALPNASSANIKTAADAIVTNGSIFENVPISAISAVIQTTTETAVDISDED